MKLTMTSAALCLSAALSMTTPAEANFVDDYLAGKHFCGKAFPSPNELVSVTSGLLLGKVPADWTDEDIASFPAALQRCVQTARARGVQVDLGGTNFDTLNDRDYKAMLNAIAEAKVAKTVQDEESGASKRFAEAENKRALENADRERQAAEERSKQAEADRVVAVQEAKDKMAKDQAEITAAHARSEAALAHQKAFAMEAEASRASEAADRAEAAERQAGADAAAQKATSTRASEARTHAAPQEQTVDPKTTPAAPAASTAYNSFLHGDEVALTVNTFGCPAEDSLDKTFVYFLQGDIEAGTRAARANGCVVVSAGLRATIEDTSIFHHTLCLHPRGSASCMWFSRNVVKVIKRG